MQDGELEITTRDIDALNKHVDPYIKVISKMQKNSNAKRSLVQML